MNTIRFGYLGREEMSRVFGTALSLLLMLALACFLGCEGDEGPEGPPGDPGDPGVGDPGQSNL